MSIMGPAHGRVPSSQLLSPDPQLVPGRLPTGTLLVAEVRRLSRARLMGISSSPSSFLSTASAQQPPPPPPHQQQLPPDQLTPHPTHSLLLTSTDLITPQDALACRGPSSANLADSHFSTDRTPVPGSFNPNQLELATPSNKPARTPRVSSENTMLEDDTSSELSSELEIQHTPTAQSRIQSLLYVGSHSPSSRQSPSTKSRGNPLEKNALLDTAPDELLSTHHGQMPSSFVNLLALHNALEKALLLHLATQGANAAMTVVNSTPPTCPTETNTLTPPARDERMKTPEPDQQRSRRALSPEEEEDLFKTFRLESLVSWPVIKPIVERGSGKHFGERELAQLLWLWQNDPDDDSNEAQTTQVRKRKKTATPDMDEPLDHSSAQRDHVGEAKEQVGMGFIISRVRSLDPSGTMENKRLRYTYGLGLEIKARENRRMPTYSLQSPGKSNEFLESPSRSFRSASTENKSRKSPSRIKAKDVMNLVALWSSKSVDRKAEVARRLRSYWLSRSAEPGHPQSQGPPTSPSNLQRIAVPLGCLPKLDPTTHKLPTHPFNRPPSASSSQLPSLHQPDLKRHRLDLTRNSDRRHSPSPKRPKVNPHSRLPSSNTNDPNSTVPSISSPGSGSVQHRALSLLERIKAKEEKQANLINQQSPTRR
ncbi:hypothetical protein PGTUg99_022477 [Puccinia graminis f. sp. tritici]|uniref:Uncharacterized protein n=1 Tax=Puccinia graminis f. sp. tritici TaxID=56615 RepID=A0A5B0S551_PUCGR|nr:hypothetical protein PGTUg99_022477 [Puccinia graminis f. sp. tritici]